MNPPHAPPDPTRPFEAGVVSVTFRELMPAEVVALAADVGLASVEWGGDVHVPPGDLGNARAVARMTADAGLRVACYGSYLRLGERGDGHGPAAFAPVIETAAALGAPAVRVWAGRRSSTDDDDACRRAVIDDARRLADLAGADGIDVLLEHHANTLTDRDGAAVALLRAIDHPRVGTLWQPQAGRTVADRCDGLRRMLPWLGHVHAFHWPAPGVRADLADGTGDWRAYLDVLRDAPRPSGRPLPVLLEFVRGDDPEQFRRDAATLTSWVDGAAAPD